MTGFRIIAAPPGRFYADPFLLEHNGRHFLLFEDGSLADGKGRIVYCEIYEDTSVSLPAVALERDYHVSYPFPFVTEDQLLMVPETSDRSAIEVFRAKGFPGAFTPCCTLMKDCRLVDPTIVRWAGKLWLFAHTDPRVRSDFEGLHRFYADGVFGPWHPHPMNPVVCDAGSARPAGAVFELDDRLVRPAQDCSLRYGHQIVFNCIEQLDLSAYREREIGRITSEWLPIASLPIRITAAVGSKWWMASGSHRTCAGSIWRFEECRGSCTRQWPPGHAGGPDGGSGRSSSKWSSERAGLSKLMGQRGGSQARSPGDQAHPLKRRRQSSPSRPLFNR